MENGGVEKDCVENGGVENGDGVETVVVKRTAAYLCMYYY